MGSLLFRPVSHQFERSQTKLFVSASDEREKKALRVPVVFSMTRAEEFGMDFVRARPNVEVMRVASVCARSTSPRLDSCLGLEKQPAARVGRAVSWPACRLAVSLDRLGSNRQSTDPRVFLRFFLFFPVGFGCRRNRLR